MSLTSPTAWKVPQLASFATTAGLMSTQSLRTVAGSKFPTAIEFDLIHLPTFYGGAVYFDASDAAAVIVRASGTVLGDVTLHLQLLEEFEILGSDQHSCRLAVLRDQHPLMAVAGAAERICEVPTQLADRDRCRDTGSAHGAT